MVESDYGCDRRFCDIICLTLHQQFQEVRRNMDLSQYSAKSFDRGAKFYVEAAWLLLGRPLFRSFIPGSRWRSRLIRFFGARVGSGVVFKPYADIKFPWRLSVGSYSWIGERVWIDNLAHVEIGSNVCVSQDVYICTGSHDWNSDDFKLVVSGVKISDKSWLCARVTVCPGCVIEEGAVIGMGSLAKGNYSAWTVSSGHPAVFVRTRRQVGLRSEIDELVL